MGKRWLWKFLAILLLLFEIGNGEYNQSQEESIEVQGNSSSRFNPKIVDSSNGEENQETFADSNQSHSRKKRLIWITEDGRLAFPPGMTLTMTPTIAMPLVRYPPEGFLSNITISLPVTLDFDKLGLTDNENPLGVLPPVFARSFGRAAGSMLGNYIASYMHYRKKRETFNSKAMEKKSQFNINFEPPEELVEPEMPADYRHAFHGGERAILYGVAEDFLTTFGLNGKACLLRAICEVHSRSLDRFGVFGEIVKLFLTASKSPFADHLTEYIQAQEIGEGNIGPGECFPYYKDCPRGLFKAFPKHRYSENIEDDDEANQIFDDSYNEIENDVLDKKRLKEKLQTNVKSM